MTSTITPVRGRRTTGHDGFAQLVRAEWTKFRTVRSWIVGLIIATVLTAGVTIALANISSSNGSLPAVATGPGGVAVTDSFYFVHRSLDGNGGITVRVTSLTDGLLPGQVGAGTAGSQPWAKAGIIIKQSIQAGSAYAAIMATPGHGVRMQYNYTQDVVGLTGAVSSASPRWLRLVRIGDAISGYDSADGTHWSLVGTVRLTQLNSAVLAGLFVASPQALDSSGSQVLTQAKADFDNVSLRGGWSASSWSGCEEGAQELGASVAEGCVQGSSGGLQPGGLTQSGSTFAVAGTGDIAPYVPSVDVLGLVIKGSLAGLVAVIALGALFVGSEYRRDLIRTTFSASPRRARVVLAKALVIGAAVFVAGLVGTVVALLAAGPKLRANGWTAPIYPDLTLATGTVLRIAVGTAALLAVAAILILGIAVMTRRTTGAITAGIVLVVGPLILAQALGQAPAAFLLRVTPSAAFSVQQGVQRYPQSSAACLASHGCYPLAPWTGVAVLAAWAVAALIVAMLLVRRRDA